MEEANLRSLYLGSYLSFFCTIQISWLYGWNLERLMNQELCLLASLLITTDQNNVFITLDGGPIHLVIYQSLLPPLMNKTQIYTEADSHPNHFTFGHSCRSLLEDVKTTNASNKAETLRFPNQTSHIVSNQTLYNMRPWFNCFITL